jgi:hypothetical protein
MDRKKLEEVREYFSKFKTSMSNQGEVAYEVALALIDKYLDGSLWMSEEEIRGIIKDYFGYKGIAEPVYNLSYGCDLARALSGHVGKKEDIVYAYDVAYTGKDVENLLCKNLPVPSSALTRESELTEALKKIVGTIGGMEANPNEFVRLVKSLQIAEEALAHSVPAQNLSREELVDIIIALKKGHQGCVGFIEDDGEYNQALRDIEAVILAHSASPKEKCLECNGKGYFTLINGLRKALETGSDVCPECSGTGTLQKEREQK